MAFGDTLQSDSTMPQNWGFTGGPSQAEGTLTRSMLCFYIVIFNWNIQPHGLNRRPLAQRTFSKLSFS